MIYVFILLQVLRVLSGLRCDSGMLPITNEEMSRIKRSVRSLLWGHPSNEFDDTRIELTRPGFGVILQVDPKGWIQKLVDALGEERALTRTREESFHMTMFQVHIMIQKDTYDSSTLPHNIFPVFNDYISKELNKMISSIKDVTGCFRVKSCGEVIVLGRNYPSHLAARVDLETIDDSMEDVKKKLNGLGYEWIKEFARALKEEKGLEGEVASCETGVGVLTDGWRFSIGYTSNRDYKTHISLGMLKSGNCKYDELSLWASEDPEREIDMDFGEGGGKDDTNSKAEELCRANEEIGGILLRSLQPEDLCDYLELKKQVERARKGERPEMNSRVLKEWSAYLVSSRLGDIQENARKTKGEEVRLIRLKYSTINMNRIQNYEPYGVFSRSTREEAEKDEVNDGSGVGRRDN
ncbi:biotin ligase [Encephalitozoon hellem]|uniref:Biotin ligase n=1 Tax=Encephalitozoon hellem TaxID=27973 RepID=A0ABY8CLT6_ENCHE|nr:biotin ligase [Encephalitozoon hellem]